MGFFEIIIVFLISQDKHHEAKPLLLEHKTMFGGGALLYAVGAIVSSTHSYTKYLLYTNDIKIQLLEVIMLGSTIPTTATMHQQYPISGYYKQKRGRMNKNGRRIGTISRDEPQVHKLPTMAIMMIIKSVKLTMKHPPRFLY